VCIVDGIVYCRSIDSSVEDGSQRGIAIVDLEVGYGTEVTGISLVRWDILALLNSQ
jgi:hypothetical protein